MKQSNLYELQVNNYKQEARLKRAYKINNVTSEFIEIEHNDNKSVKNGFLDFILSKEFDGAFKTPNFLFK